MIESSMGLGLKWLAVASCKRLKESFLAQHLVMGLLVTHFTASVGDIGLLRLVSSATVSAFWLDIFCQVYLHEEYSSKQINDMNYLSCSHFQLSLNFLLVNWLVSAWNWWQIWDIPVLCQLDSTILTDTFLGVDLCLFRLRQKTHFPRQPLDCWLTIRSFRPDQRPPHRSKKISSGTGISIGSFSSL